MTCLFQLYLRVCNIGQELKADMSRQEGGAGAGLRSRLVQTVNTKLELVTNSQSRVIEQWSKQESRAREEQAGKQVKTTADFPMLAFFSFLSVLCPVL